MLSGVKACKSCRSRQELSNEYLLAKCGFDTAENGPLKVCQKNKPTVRKKVRTNVGGYWRSWSRRKPKECRKERKYLAGTFYNVSVSFSLRCIVRRSIRTIKKSWNGELSEVFCRTPLASGFLGQIA